MSHQKSASENLVKVTQEVNKEIISAIEAIRFGSVEITVHDGRITQIERREKVRVQDILHRVAKPTVNTAARHN